MPVLLPLIGAVPVLTFKLITFPLSTKTTHKWFTKSQSEVLMISTVERDTQSLVASDPLYRVYLSHRDVCDGCVGVSLDARKRPLSP
jgi:hypothetical protein